MRLIVCALFSLFSSWEGGCPGRVDVPLCSFLSTSLGLPYWLPLPGMQADGCVLLGFSEHVFLPSCIFINVDVLASICSLLFFRSFRSLFGKKGAIYWCPSGLQLQPRVALWRLNVELWWPAITIGETQVQVNHLKWQMAIIVYPSR